MEVKQIYELTNTIVKEVLGETAVVNEDLSNLVDIGTALFNANAVENYTRKLVDHIGKVVFVNRNYEGMAPKVLMDGWEFGSVLEKISGDLPEAEENESWELEDGTVYEQDQFYKPSVEVKFFNSKVTFEIPVSIADRQVKSAFDGAVQMNAFLSMIISNVEKAMTLRMDSLILRTIDNYIAQTVKAEYDSETIDSKSTVKAVNLLKLYNDEKGTSLTASTALKDTEFIKYASYTLKLYASRMSKMSTLFNIGGRKRFTPRELMHIVLLEDFKSASDVYLQSDTYHNELTKLPDSESIPYWQGTGVNYDFDSISKINVKTASGDTVEVTGVLGVIFDRDALGVSNLDRRVKSHVNDKAEFTNFWYKQDAGYFNDFNENFVVFFIA